jgi:hypothetical protein
MNIFFGLQSVLAVHDTKELGVAKVAGEDERLGVMRKDSLLYKDRARYIG